MDKKDKQKLSESDICDLYITPAIKDAGWKQLVQIRREVTLTPGPVVVRGNVSARNNEEKCEIRSTSDAKHSCAPGRT